METAASDSAGTRREDERDFLRLVRSPEFCSEWVVTWRRKLGHCTASTGEETMSPLFSSFALSASSSMTSALNRRTLAKGLAISVVGEREPGVGNRD